VAEKKNIMGFVALLVLLLICISVFLYLFIPQIRVRFILILTGDALDINSQWAATQIRESGIPILIDIYNETKNPETREAMIETMWNIGGEKAFHKLQEIVTDSSESIPIRKMAITFIANGNFEGTDMVLVDYLDIDNVEVRASAAFWLRRFHNESISQILLTALSTNSDSLVISYIMRSLGYHRYSLAVPAILANLQHESMTVRRSAYAALRMILGRYFGTIDDYESTSKSNRRYQG
jgi:HEAT repeat protein